MCVSSVIVIKRIIRAIRIKIRTKANLKIQKEKKVTHRKIRKRSSKKKMMRSNQILIISISSRTKMIQMNRKKRNKTQKSSKNIKNT